MKTRVPSWIRHRQEAAVEDLVYVLRCAATDDAAEVRLEAAMRMSHDALIADLADRRRSGVQWLVVDAWKAPGLIEELQMPGDFTDLLAHLVEHPEGRLVIAMAKAVRE